LQNAIEFAEQGEVSARLYRKDGSDDLKLEIRDKEQSS
jgi:hypothetical protein